MLKMFAVRDVKSDAFGNIMLMPTVGLAVRAFGEAAVDARSPIRQYPDDFSLYELGEYDPNSGGVKPLAQPKYIVSASEVIASMKSVVSDEVKA